MVSLMIWLCLSALATGLAKGLRSVCKGYQHITLHSHEVTAVIQEWYSGALVQHGANILDAVLPVVQASQPKGNTPKVMVGYVASAGQTYDGAMRLAIS